MPRQATSKAKEPWGEPVDDASRSVIDRPLAPWLTRDLGLNPQGVALVLDLLDEIAALRARGGR